MVVDEEKFYEIVSRKIYDPATIPVEYLPSNNYYTYHGSVAGSNAYIVNCKCIRDPKVIQDKLVMIHWYGGGSSKRESTILYWNGEYYQNPKGEYIVDVIQHTDVVDIRRAMITEKKVYAIEGLKLQDTNFIWINLIGYDQLIPYAYD